MQRTIRFDNVYVGCIQNNANVYMYTQRNKCVYHVTFLFTGPHICNHNMGSLHFIHGRYSGMSLRCCMLRFTSRVILRRKYEVKQGFV